MPKRVLLAAPRGYCAGVDRAVITVEKALELYGAPVYVRKEIVHNKHVVESLKKRGAIFSKRQIKSQRVHELSSLHMAFLRKFMKRLQIVN